MSIRKAYEELGVKAFYELTGHVYRNPHEQRVHAALDAVKDRLDLDSVLDLACGSGEVTRRIRSWSPPHKTKVLAVAPFTEASFRRLCPGERFARIGFEAISDARVLDDDHFSLCVCSYAMHLHTPSRMPELLYALSRIAGQLLILSPHKRPEVPELHWMLTHHEVVDRVHVRLFEPKRWT